MAKSGRLELAFRGWDYSPFDFSMVLAGSRRSRPGSVPRSGRAGSRLHACAGLSGCGAKLAGRLLSDGFLCHRSMSRRRLRLGRRVVCPATEPLRNDQMTEHVVLTCSVRARRAHLVIFSAGLGFGSTAHKSRGRPPDLRVVGGLLWALRLACKVKGLGRALLFLGLV